MSNTSWYDIVGCKLIPRYFTGWSIQADTVLYGGGLKRGCEDKRLAARWWLLVSDG